MNLISMYNKYAGENKSTIRKALDSATGGGALIPQKLEAVITNTLVRLSPELAMVQPEYDAQKYHEFNQLTALPTAGGAQGESSVTPTYQSTFVRTGVNLKVIKRKGAVSGFLQDASRKYVDAVAVEMENHILTHAWDLATYILWGNATANPYEFGGLDTFIATNRDNYSSSSGQVPSSTKILDDMIDANLQRQGIGHKVAFVMSPQMLSKFSQLLTNVRNIQNPAAGQGISEYRGEVAGGWRMDAYRGVPIIVTGATRPKGAMGTITAASGGTTGGSFSDGTYYFTVAPITYNGEECANASGCSVTLSGGTSTQTITLSFTAYTGALGYKVYYGSTSTVSSMTLISRQPAFSYDANGTIVAALTSLTVLSASRDSSVSTAMANDTPLLMVNSVPQETIMFWDLDKYQGLGKLAYSNTAGSRFEGLATVEPLAKIDDNYPFLIKSYAALVPAFEATSYIKRGLRVA